MKHPSKPIQILHGHPLVCFQKSWLKKHLHPQQPENAVNHKGIDDQTGNVNSIPEVIQKVVRNEHVPRLLHTCPQWTLKWRYWLQWCFKMWGFWNVRNDTSFLPWLLSVKIYIFGPIPTLVEMAKVQLRHQSPISKVCCQLFTSYKSSIYIYIYISIYIYIYKYIPPKTNTYPLKKYWLQDYFPFEIGPFLGEKLVFAGVYIYKEMCVKL